MTCTLCPIHQEGCLTNCMGGTGAFGRIVFLGEAPGETEDRQGMPFVGPAGQLLRAGIKDVGLRDHAYFTNVIRCRPHMNHKPSIHEIRICRDNHLLPELKRINPKMIVALGDTAGQCVTDSHLFRVSTERGSKVTWSGWPVLFTYHPSAIQYDRRVKQYFQEDLHAAKEWYDAGCPMEGRQQTRILDWEDLWEKKYINGSRLGVALDIETTALDPYGTGKVLSLAAATDESTVFFRLVEPQDSLEEILDPLCLYGTVITHNGPAFDWPWLTNRIKANHPIWDAKWADTLTLLQFIDERYPNLGLAHLAWVFANTRKLEMPWFLKEGCPSGWKSAENVRLLRRYNAMDAICTLRLYRALHERLAGKPTVLDWVNANQKLAVRIRNSGIHIDLTLLRKMEEEIGGKAQKYEQWLMRRANIHSTDAMKCYLFTKLKLPVVERTHKTGQPSLTKDVLEHLEGRDPTGFIKNYRKWKELTKLRDTYLPNLRKSDGCAHPKVFLTRSPGEGGGAYGSDTGRVTTEMFTTLPREGDVKKCIVSRYGKDGLIVSVDYSQIEMRVLADLCRDEGLLKAFREKLDLHTYTAAQVHQIPMDEVTPEQRQRAKAVNFGIVYGQSAYGLSRTTGMSPVQAEAFIDAYFKQFPGVHRYIEHMIRQAVKNKYVVSPTGRVFHLPNADHEKSHESRKALNSPIQSGANDICTEAANEQHRWFQQTTIRGKGQVILMVYDSVVSDIHRSIWKSLEADLDYIYNFHVVRVMKQWFNWDIQVPLTFDVKKGERYG